MRRRSSRLSGRPVVSPRHQPTAPSHEVWGNDETASRILRAWQMSRQTTAANDDDDSLPSEKAPSPPPTLFLRSGVPRKFTVHNFRIAAFLLSQCWLDAAKIVLALHPIRMPLMILFTLIQGTLPAYQTYSQAAILDELQRLLMSGDLGPKRQALIALVQLLFWELCRALLIRLFETYVNYNSTTVQQSVRLHFQYVQLQNRLRLDIPALADPLVQDLLDESNRFVNAFASGANTILTPLGLVTLLRDFSQILSQATVFYTLLLSSRAHTSYIFTTVLVILPKFPSLLRTLQNWILSPEDDWPDDEFSRRAAAVKRRIAHMENLAYSATYKAEIVLFGLADWILAEWSRATKDDMELDQAVNSRGIFMANTSVSSRSAAAFRSLASDLFSEAEVLLRNAPNMLQYGNASLGTVSLTRNAVDRIYLSLRSIQSCVRWSFDAAFDLGAFHCAMNMRPYMEARSNDRVLYHSTRSACGKSGMKIEMSDLHFTFPGHVQPTLRGINLTINPGETVAIVGLNGSGKSTLLAVLARLVDFSSGSYRVNGVDTRRLDAADLHASTSAIFQSFCKFEQASVRENAGVGDVATLKQRQSPDSEKEVQERIMSALEAAGAKKFVEDFSDGLATLLEADGMGRARHNHHLQHYDHPPPPYASTSFQHNGSYSPHGSPDGSAKLSSDGAIGRARLSGGQWQRIAIARALMRKDKYDLMLIDEANSALDPRGQRELFQGLCDQPNHGTIVFVTHRLEALQWADKVAVVENGRITAFGTPHETKQDVCRVFELSKDE